MITNFVSDEVDFKHLKYILGRFSFEGDFLGYTELNTELSLCPMSYGDVLSQRLYGTQIESKCEISLDLITAVGTAAPADTNVFYELYVEDKDGVLMEIPVLIRNYRYGDGKTPNVGFEPIDSWVLVRRFFMTETLTGFEIGQSAKTPKYVRLAKDVRLKIMMDSDIKEQIYRPLLIIEYVEVEPVMVPKFEVFYSVNYFSDYTKSMGKIVIFFSILLIFIILAAFMQCIAYTKRNPSKAFGIKKWPIKFIEIFFDYFADYMFWFIFIACLIIFFSFKIGMAPSKLLPDEGEASQKVQAPFYGLFGTVVVMKTVAVGIKIYNQSTIDIFLVDNEQPNRQTKSVVAWRHYFVANEFAELQGEERYISPEVTLIWFVFFWVGLGWEHVVKAEPDLSVTPDDKKVVNILLELFFAGVLFFSIGYVQLGIHRFMSKTPEGSAVTGFVDLCTLANVSILMFDEESHGYYVHAQAPWGSSDIPLVELSRELSQEDNPRGRGLKHSSAASSSDTN